MGEARSELPKPHALLIPLPSQGHINPMFKLAKLLHQRGFHITFVNTEFNHQRILKCHGAGDFEALPTFHFTALPCSDYDVMQDHSVLISALRTRFLASFRDLVSGVLMKSASSIVPPLTCIISDAFMTFTLDLAQERSLPIVLFWALSASTVLAIPQSRKLIESGVLPLKEEQRTTNVLLDTVLAGIPGLDGMRIKDLPTFVQITDAKDPGYEILMEIFEKSHKGSAAAVILNTFEDLEPEAIRELSFVYPKLLTIGPLHQLSNQIHNDKLDSFGTNMWKEDASCLPWLDSKPPNSVLFVSFGTTALLKHKQLIELAWGLAKSKLNFLWIIRSDLVFGSNAVLPPEFEAEVKERALLTCWCPQEKVLRHPSIGGFLSHGGWNSMLESICAGVPMLCWSERFDQTTNSWICCNQLGMGMEIRSDVKRDGVEKLVKELMMGRKGMEMKKKVMELKKKADEACLHGSSLHFQELVMLLLCGVQKV